MVLSPPLADPSLTAQDRFVVQAHTDGRWARYCSDRETAADARQVVLVAELDRPELQFRIVRATTTFEVIR